MLTEFHVLGKPSKWHVKFFCHLEWGEDLDRLQHYYVSDGLDSLPLHSVPLERRNFQL